MDKLELWYPAKPFTVTQAWGIYNPAYLQFGFDHHNGIDFLLESDSLLHSPSDAMVLDIGFTSGAGNYVRLISHDTYEKGYLCQVFMHLKEQKVKAGDEVKIGDVLAIADNTGFSTGPHTHWACYWGDANGQKLESNNANGTFDQSVYFNNYFAIDAQKVGIIKKLLDLYKQLYEKLYGVPER